MFTARTVLLLTLLLTFSLHHIAGCTKEKTPPLASVGNEWICSITPNGGRSSRAGWKPAKTSRPMAQLSISYLSFEQPAEEFNCIVGRSWGLNMMALAASSCLPQLESCEECAQVGLRESIPIKGMARYGWSPTPALYKGPTPLWIHNSGCSNTSRV
ncbi:hypothetical protein AAES_160364 [Amazona aestiva]|uniref:Secreted protein n=1 Tax=Amazona aestiva TaxID=12930 RepID=A0A0Q3P0G4_AMAAE|nr:hypothetical protein AAES_160364 [Amazona aestiva]